MPRDAAPVEDPGGTIWFPFPKTNASIQARMEHILLGRQPTDASKPR